MRKKLYTPTSFQDSFPTGVFGPDSPTKRRRKEYQSVFQSSGSCCLERKRRGVGFSGVQ